MKKHMIGRKVFMWLLMITVLLILCISCVISIQYRNNKMRDYTRIAFSYTRAAAEYIDGDTIEHYINSGQKDEYYDDVENYLNITQKNSDLLYYYVYIPKEDHVVYVWDADNEKGACQLGEKEEYMKGGKESAENIFKQNPPENLLINRDEKYGYIASAFSPIFNSAGEPVAVASADIFMPGVHAAFFRFIGSVSISVICVVLFSMIGFFIFVRKNIINPINTLNKATKDMVKNLDTNDVIKIEVHTGDEIEELSHSFMNMDIELRDYIQRLSKVTAEKERIGAELQVATQIQANMLPCIFPAFPERKEFNVYATMNPAKEVGGDFYDFFMVDDSHVAFVMADVSGKGVPAALFMVIGKTLLKDHTVPGVPLGQVFMEVNNLLCETNKEGLFITAFEAVLDLKTGEMEYVNAGHELPFICKKNGNFAPFKIKAGFVLAGMEDIAYKSSKLQLEVGDRLYQYTDGVTEATNAENELYGMERLEAVLNMHKDSSLDELLHAVRQDIDKFVRDAPQFDDITMLCVEYKERYQDKSC